MPNTPYITKCDTCGRGTWYETEQPCHCSYPKTNYCDTCGHTEQVEPYEEEKCTGTLRIIDNSELDERFRHYYETGERIEVLYKDGTKERFYIGKSTGIKPIWLTIKKSNSFGGGGLLCDFVETITPLNKFI